MINLLIDQYIDNNCYQNQIVVGYCQPNKQREYFVCFFFYHFLISRFPSILLWNNYNNYFNESVLSYLLIYINMCNQSHWIRIKLTGNGINKIFIFFMSYGVKIKCRIIFIIIIIIYIYTYKLFYNVFLFIISKLDFYRTHLFSFCWKICSLTRYSKLQQNIFIPENKPNTN